MSYEKELFVFGSNEAGRHGGGAARYAYEKYGAMMGMGFGPAGHSFAIPTKDWGIQTLAEEDVKFYVDRFLDFALAFDNIKFRLTRIGCGLAGFSDKDIAPMFVFASDNVILIDDNGNDLYPASRWYDHVLAGRVFDPMP